MPVFDADIIQERIDTYWKDHQEDGRRGHLGGSLIGRECLRELWYSFRWATVTKHQGRILRLFDRGHKEEFRFVEFLQQLGCEVREYAQRLVMREGDGKYQLQEWDEEITSGWIDVSSSPLDVRMAKEDGVKPKQWRISDCDGHFGGSLDGIVYNFPEFEIAANIFLCAEDPVLVEFKTHGLKSFNDLAKKGLKDAKPEHYAQMQVYMHKRGIKIGLYMAVNKNTDELKCFWVTSDTVEAVGLLGKAGIIIEAPTPPLRMSTNPSWYKCRFCDHRKTCHMGEPMAKGCRTCAFSKPVEGGKWHCAKWDNEIPSKEAQKAGCDAYHAIEG